MPLGFAPVVRRVGNFDFQFRFAGNFRLRHGAVASFHDDNPHFQVHIV
jgi:hypothetical protein